jgi:hypothetical protein
VPRPIFRPGPLGRGDRRRRTLPGPPPRIKPPAAHGWRCRRRGRGRGARSRARGCFRYCPARRRMGEARRRWPGGPVPFAEAHHRMCRPIVAARKTLILLHASSWQPRLGIVWELMSAELSLGEGTARGLGNHEPDRHVGPGWPALRRLAGPVPGLHPGWGPVLAARPGTGPGRLGPSERNMLAVPASALNEVEAGAAS